MRASLSRRSFLALAAAAPALPGGAAPARRGARLGIALGGGGARGLAHVEILGVLDELGVKPDLIAGTSMGAVIGALYASGRSADDMKALVTDALLRRDHYLGFVRKELLERFHLIDPGMTQQVLLGSGDFIEFIHRQIGPGTFADLRIPLLAVAADIQRREQVVLGAGDLTAALEASIAFPGLFRPVTIDGRPLVDGGIVNPVPYDLLTECCDIVIAVDVSGRRTYAADAELSFFDLVFESFLTMEKSIMAAKMNRRPPDLYVKPDLVDVHLLDFGKADVIYRQAGPARDRFRTQLRELLAQGTA